MTAPTDPVVLATAQDSDSDLVLAMLQSKGVDYSGFMGSVGTGWLPLVTELVDDLLALGWDRDLHQIKEKFGGLRFYIGSGTEAIFNRIDEAERRSFFVCEACGSPGEPRRNRPWVLTLCDGCNAKGVR